LAKCFPMYLYWGNWIEKNPDPVIHHLIVRLYQTLDKMLTLSMTRCPSSLMKIMWLLCRMGWVISTVSLSSPVVFRQEQAWVFFGEKTHWKAGKEITEQSELHPPKLYDQAITSKHFPTYCLHPTYRDQNLTLKQYWIPGIWWVTPSQGSWLHGPSL